MLVAFMVRCFDVNTIVNDWAVREVLTAESLSRTLP
jgi:hypothetical protein